MESHVSMICSFQMGGGGGGLQTKEERMDEKELMTELKEK